MRITLCGSARFEPQFHEWNERLTLAGHVVYGLAVYPSQKGGNKDWYGSRPELKHTLDLVHLAKIENSDAVAVLNVGGYVGDSTRREAEWAAIRGKKIFWLERGRPALAELIMKNYAPDLWAAGLVPGGEEDAA